MIPFTGQRGQVDGSDFGRYQPYVQRKRLVHATRDTKQVPSKVIKRQGHLHFLGASLGDLFSRIASAFSVSFSCSESLNLIEVDDDDYDDGDSDIDERERDIDIDDSARRRTRTPEEQARLAAEAVRLEREGIVV